MTLRIAAGQGIGEVMLGAKREAVDAAFGTPSVYAEGAIALLTYADRGIDVTLYKGAVMSVETKSKDAATEEGLRVGSTEAEIVAVLGPPIFATTTGDVKLIRFAQGIRFKLGASGVAFAVSIEAAEVAASEPKPKKTKDKGKAKSPFEEMDLAWFNENHENVNSRSFVKVWHADGDVTLSAKEVAELLGKEDAALVVDGALVVNGLLDIDDHHAVHVGGKLTCDALRIAAGVLNADGVEVVEWLDFGCDDTQRMETFDPGASLQARVILCPFVDVDDLAPDVDHTFTCNDVDDELDGLRKMLETHFSKVVAALDKGDVIDDAWVRANG